MKKNVASQKIGAQMVSATDGSAFTGAVTVAVTGDAGVQATGSVGSGACTHEGNGYHTYAPAQAETNYDLIAFTFTGTGAVPATVQVFTDFPQTGDVFGALPSNFSSFSVDASGRVDVIKVAGTTQTAGDIIGDTNDIQTRLPAALVSGRIDASVGAMAANVVTASAIAADAIGASELAADAANEIADAILDRDMSTGTDSGSATVRTVRQALRFLRNKWSISGSTLTVTKEDDTTSSWTAALTTDAAANPVTASDPASA